MMDLDAFAELVGPEWVDWYLMTPVERWRASAAVWNTYLALGGSLDPEPNSQSPFFDADEWRALAPHGGQAWVLYGGAEFRRGPSDCAA